MNRICIDYRRRTGNQKMVFVECVFKSGKNKGLTGFKLMKKEIAEKEKLPIITCSLCEKPAVVVDHFFPFIMEQNRCEEHENSKRRR